MTRMEYFLRTNMRRKTRKMKQQQEGTVIFRIGQNSTKAFLDKVEKNKRVIEFDLEH